VIQMWLETLTVDLVHHRVKSLKAVPARCPIAPPHGPLPDRREAAVLMILHCLVPMPEMMTLACWTPCRGLMDRGRFQRRTGALRFERTYLSSSKIFERKRGSSEWISQRIFFALKLEQTLCGPGCAM